MEISDFENTYQVRSDAELEQVLLRRYAINGADVNSFELGHEQPYPMMCVWVKDELASLWFTPEEDDPGWISVGANTSSKGDTVLFYLRKDHQPRPMASVVSFADAQHAAKQFLHSKSRPECVRWLKL